MSDTPNAQARKVQSVRGTKGDAAKEARIKAALKANIAKRKAQTKSKGQLATGGGKAQGGGDD